MPLMEESLAHGPESQNGTSLLADRIPKRFPEVIPPTG
jgi:hypothetical protein